MTTYDYTIIAVGGASMVGIIVCTVLMERHKREIRVRRLIKLETGVDLPKCGGSMNKLFKSIVRTLSKD